VVRLLVTQPKRLRIRANAAEGVADLRFRTVCDVSPHAGLSSALDHQGDYYTSTLEPGEYFLIVSGEGGSDVEIQVNYVEEETCDDITTERVPIVGEVLNDPMPLIGKPSEVDGFSEYTGTVLRSNLPYYSLDGHADDFTLADESDGQRTHYADRVLKVDLNELNTRAWADGERYDLTFPMQLEMKLHIAGERPIFDVDLRHGCHQDSSISFTIDSYQSTGDKPDESSFITLSATIFTEGNYYLVVKSTEPDQFEFDNFEVELDINDYSAIIDPLN